jgi:hypothetical protein
MRMTINNDLLGLLSLVCGELSNHVQGWSGGSIARHIMIEQQGRIYFKKSIWELLQDGGSLKKKESS